MTLLRNVFTSEGIEASLLRLLDTTQILGGTISSFLWGSNHSDSLVSMRTGHRNVYKSLKRFQNLLSIEVRLQQDNFLAPIANPKKRSRINCAWNCEQFLRCKQFNGF